MTTTKHHLAEHPATTCDHEWSIRGYCEDCGAGQPDYNGPDDANMPYLAVNTDTPDSTTYPWN